jgi:hypothetical protein
MTPGRIARPLAWIGGAGTVLLFATGAILALVAPSGGGIFDAQWPLPFAAMALVGAFVAVRRPDNSTGWLLLFGGLLMVANGFAQSYGAYSLATGGRLPATHVVAWLGLWTWMPAVSLISLVLIVFPTGRPLSSFWRGVMRVGYATAGASVFLAVPALRASASALHDAPSPGAVPGGDALELLNLPLPVFLAIGFVAVVVRFVRARGVERLQMKWFVYGTSVLAVGSLITGGSAVLLGVDDPIGNPVAAGTIELGMIAIPITAGFGILRYRLFDIDRIVSRTVSYGIITVILGGIFSLIVLVPIFVIGSGSAPDYVIAAATLIVAAMFRPVRRRVQSTVDHRFNRRRYDAEHTIEAFTTRLREQVDIDALGAELRGVVAQTMQPAHVSLWIRGQAQT